VILLLVILAGYIAIACWVGSMLRTARELASAKPRLPVARAISDQQLDISEALHRMPAVRRRRTR
jgi:hypothetical protein